jgi:hypothetical protein
MPIKPGNLDPVREALGLCFPHFASGSPEIRVHNHSADYVQHVKSGHREIDGKKSALAWDFTNFNMM